MANFFIIRDLCEQRKITIRELANRIERDESTIQTLIRKGTTNTTTLESIANVLGVSPGVFFDGYSSDNATELQKENEHLKDLLKEKERLIEVLMSERKG